MSYMKLKRHRALFVLAAGLGYSMRNFFPATMIVSLQSYYQLRTPPFLHLPPIDLLYSVEFASGCCPHDYYKQHEAAQI